MRFHFCLTPQPALNPPLPAEQTPRPSVLLPFPLSPSLGTKGLGLAMN